MSYPPCRYARRWPELWAQQRSDNNRRILSSILASGRLDGQEPSRAFVDAFIDRILGRITREECEQDAARLSPLGHAHVNELGRYGLPRAGPRRGPAPAA
jgi:hypothetical protein